MFVAVCNYNAILNKHFKYGLLTKSCNTINVFATMPIHCINKS